MGWRCWCVVLVVVVVFQPVIDSASASSIVKNLPGYDGYLPFNLETGYVGVGEDEAVQLFYLFVESERNPLFDPLLLWFVGGPGCSALSAFFFENGPLRMDQNFSGNIPKLELNPYSWTHMLSMLYIDIPVGTGFSYSKTQQGYYSSDTLWVEHTYAFLQKWFIDHPKFNSNPFYVGGGSYSGYPTAPLVQKLYDGYVAGRVPRINIKGYVIASPGVDAYESENTKVLYAYQMSLIPESLYQSIKEHCGGNYVNIDPEDTKCVSDYEAYSELVRYINPQQILEPLCETTPGVNHGILQSSLQHRSEFWCRSYSHILVNTWANDESVRKALYIREGTKGEFLRCNKTLAYNVTLLSVAGYYQNLTKANIQALVYCSDLDMSIPHIATQNWIKSLKLSIYDKWRAWFVDGQVAGFTEIYKMKEDHYLTYVSVKNKSFGGTDLALKVDMSKAYDRVEWSFVWFVMEKLGFCQRWIEWYGSLSGQIINFSKSAVFFSKNTPLAIKEEIATFLRVPNIGAQDKYLGLPSIVNRSKCQTFAYVKDKVSKKLQDWKHQLLSASGREILIKAVGCAIPIYTLSCFKLPESLLDDIHKMMMQF
ncbi:hypothetical protein AHAS_Ahas14G0011000 [Arachis hypogaea]